MVPTINEEFTLDIWNSMLIKLRLQCIGNVCCVLVYSQSVYSTQLCVHTEQWIHNFWANSCVSPKIGCLEYLYLTKKKIKRPLAG